MPIRANGHRPYLILPDEVNFGTCAVKLPTKKILLIQNMGSTDVKFTLTSTHDAYGCRPEPLSLQAGGCLVSLIFTHSHTHTPLDFHSYATLLISTHTALTHHPLDLPSHTTLLTFTHLLPPPLDLPSHTFLLQAHPPT